VLSEVEWARGPTKRMPILENEHVNNYQTCTGGELVSNTPDCRWNLEKLFDHFHVLKKSPKQS